MSEEKRIVTPCPSCGMETLFVSESGHLTCSNLECATPSVGRFCDDRKRDYRNHEINYMAVVKRVLGRDLQNTYMHPTDAACILEGAYQKQKARANDCNDRIVLALTALRAIKIRIAFIGHPKEKMRDDGLPDWVKQIALMEAALKEMVEDVEPTMLRQIAEAVESRHICRKAYNEWHDEFYSRPRDRMSSETLKKNNNLESALRTNLCMSEQRIVDIAETIANQREKR